MDRPLPPALSPIAQQLSESSIRTIANFGMTQADVIPLWFGESDIPTPDFIRQAAAHGLEQGDTRYTPNNGIPALRTALAEYQNRLYDQQFDQHNIVVTVSGTNAVMLAAQTCISAGDKVVVITPVFPTLFAVPQLLGAKVEQLQLSQNGDRFELDLDALFHAAKDAKAIVINSPNNPTGWCATKEQIEAICEFARRENVWVISDEVYARHTYEGDSAPSFCTFMRESDPIIVCNSFSKAWCMTGWRLGWLTLPRAITPTITKLIEFNVSCAPGFVQAGGLAAITQGERFIEQTRERFLTARDMVAKALSDIPGVTLYDMPATFYAFLKIDGLAANSQPYILRMIEEAKVGVAPGEAFGLGGSEHLRICYGCDLAVLATALERIRDFLLTHRPE